MNKETMNIIMWTLGLCAIMFFLALNTFILGRNTKTIGIKLTDNQGYFYTDDAVIENIEIDCRTLVIKK